jgi:ketosteroid isomerase-like protein
MEGGKEYTGLQAIKEVHGGFLALTPVVTIETQSVTRVGDIALLRSHWQVKGTGPDGNTVEMSHFGVEVVQRQANGAWLYLIDLPFGGEGAR